MSNSFFDKKPGIITIVVLVVLAVLVVFAFEFKLVNPTKPSMYSASGKFEKLALVKDEAGTSYLQLYFVSDYGNAEKIGELKTGSVFYVVSSQNGKTTTKPGSVTTLKRGDRIVVFSKDDISQNKTVAVAKTELIK